MRQRARAAEKKKQEEFEKVIQAAEKQRDIIEKNKAKKKKDEDGDEYDASVIICDRCAGKPAACADCSAVDNPYASDGESDAASDNDDECPECGARGPHDCSETFHEARKNFQDIFRKLFQGGKADMFLSNMEEDDTRELVE